MLGFFIGLFVGAIFGVAIMCIMNVAGQSTRDSEQTDEDTENPNSDRK